MKILLLKSALKYGDFVPLGIAYIGAVLEKAGHDVQILDLAMDRIPLDKFGSVLLKYNPEVIGITGMTAEYMHIIKIASICKKFLPNTKIILGGAMASSIPERVLLQTCIDVVIIGEGEESIVEVVKKMENNQELNNVKGIGYKTGGEIKINLPRDPVDLNSIPFPARHLLKMEKHIHPFEDWLFIRSIAGKPIRATNIIATRGCSYKCIYCDKSVFGKKWRGRSASNIVDEIKFLKDEYNINGIIFNDDTFDLKRGWVYDLCDELDQSNLGVIWGCNSRVNHADKEMYQRMYESGCRFLSFGIEFGDQKILDFVQRGVTVKQIEDAINIAKRVGFRVIGYFMIGMLNENKKSIEATIELAKKLELDRSAFGMAIPMPGTHFYQLSVEKGYIIDKYYFGQMERIRSELNLTKDLTKKEIDKLFFEANWKSFWSDSNRHVPRFICKFCYNSFPAIDLIMRNRFGSLINYTNKIRQLYKHCRRL